MLICNVNKKTKDCYSFKLSENIQKFKHGKSSLSLNCLPCFNVCGLIKNKLRITLKSK